MYHVPIRADYCDAWFDACRNDLFCAAGGGDYFSCARVYKVRMLRRSLPFELTLLCFLGH